MKFKPVVVSLIMLGMMTPAFAKSRVASQQAVIDQNSIVSPVCSEGWFNRISIGGLGSVVGVVGNRDVPGTYTGVRKDSSDLYINNVNLLVNAHLSNWSKATLNLGVFGAPNLWNNLDKTTSLPSKKYNLAADEAYVTFANLAKSPFYVQVGKKYLPFGQYSDPYTPIQIMSPAQMLSQVNGVTTIVGAATNFGLYADLFALRGETSPNGSKSAGNIRNFGGRIGYYGNLASLAAPNTHVNFAASYINNLWDGQFFTPNTKPLWSYQDATVKQPYPGNGYALNAVGGIGAHADFAYEAFSVYADWVGAVKNMVNKDFSDRPSKFWGANVNTVYAFNTLGRNSSVDLGVQFSGNGKWFADNKLNTNGMNPTDLTRIIPKWRLTGEYQVKLFKNTDLGLVVAHSKSYDFTGAANSNGRNSTLGLARLMFQF